MGVCVGGSASAEPAPWLKKILAVGQLAPIIAHRDAARAAAAAIGTQAHPDPVPYRHVAELATACVDAAPPPTLADVDYVGHARGLSLAQLVKECEALRVQATSDAERSAAAQAQRAAEIRPLLHADRLKIFDAQGEPDCAACAGDARKIAAAREWTYVRGPSGPLATFETLTFVFRADRLVERRQRLSHEQP
jgi:hypothetical protein